MSKLNETLIREAIVKTGFLKEFELKITETKRNTKISIFAGGKQAITKTVDIPGEKDFKVLLYWGKKELCCSYVISILNAVRDEIDDAYYKGEE